MPALVGSAIGPYRILSEIGRGGMATVYKAYQPGTERVVALKVLPHQYSSDPQFVRRFEQEARLIAQLEHRSIIPVYDFGEREGIAYLAMRYLQGGTVLHLIARGPLPLNDVVKIVGEVASALDYAHAQGVIHRDVKPGNILIDKEGNAYLTDFGIAKVLEATAELTGSGLLGTPAYMAPEQMLGKPVTTQADVYALGVTLYEMVTGRLPYEASTPMAMALKHATEPPQPPRTIRPELPEAVDVVIEKALAKNPADRYRSAGELAQAFVDAVGESKGRVAATASRSLVAFAADMAAAKGDERLTGVELAEIKKWESTDRQRRLRRGLPYGVGGVVILVLISIVLWLSLQVQQASAVNQETATALSLTGLAATQTAGRPTNTPGPSPTLDLFAAATLQRLATQTQEAINGATQTVLFADSQASQSALETAVALTATETPLAMETNTPEPTPTATSELGLSYIQVSAAGCVLPKTIRPGIIVANVRLEGWNSEAEARAAVGDPPTLPTVPDLGSRPNVYGPNQNPATGSWGYDAAVQGGTTEPGTYQLRVTWLHLNVSCEYTVVTP